MALDAREHGVRAIDASCYCGRRAIVDVSAIPGSIEVPFLRWRLRCTGCARRGSATATAPSPR